MSLKSQGQGWIMIRRDADSSHNQHKSSQQHCANDCGAAQWAVHRDGEDVVHMQYDICYL